MQNKKASIQVSWQKGVADGWARTQAQVKRVCACAR